MIEFNLPAALLVNFGLLLSRMAAFSAFVPMPGVRASQPIARVALTLALTWLTAPLAVTSFGPDALASGEAVWELARAGLSEAALGAALGVTLRLMLEAFGLAAQALGFQAGYSYVNMVDPTSEADASILNVIFVLIANLLFLAANLHLEVLRLLAGSLRTHPLGAFSTRPDDAMAVVELGGVAFEAAVRLALPVMAVLLLIDLTLGLLNQVHSRMQLITFSFTLKLVAATAVIILTLPSAPRVFRFATERGLKVGVGLLAR